MDISDSSIGQDRHDPRAQRLVAEPLPPANRGYFPHRDERVKTSLAVNLPPKPPSRPPQGRHRPSLPTSVQPKIDIDRNWRPTLETGFSTIAACSTSRLGVASDQDRARDPSPAVVPGCSKKRVAFSDREGGDHLPPSCGQDAFFCREMLVNSLSSALTLQSGGQFGHPICSAFGNARRARRARHMP